MEKTKYVSHPSQEKTIRFSEGDVRPMGRSTRGVRGMNIGKEDK